jgi:hypothetical protein
MASGIDLTGDWTITTQFGTFTIGFTGFSSDTFIGKYIGIADSSTFVAHVLFSPRGTVLNIVQSHPDAPPGPYFAAYGAQLTPAGTFAGTLVDVGGKEGDFTLMKS